MNTHTPVSPRQKVIEEASAIRDAMQNILLIMEASNAPEIIESGFPFSHSLDEVACDVITWVDSMMDEVAS